jgi:hypothetical protein
VGQRRLALCTVNCRVSGCVDDEPWPNPTQGRAKSALVGEVHFLAREGKEFRLRRELFGQLNA